MSKANSKDKKKKNKGVLLINNSHGSINSCYKCSSPLIYHVLHMDIAWTDLRNHKDGMTKGGRTALMKAYPKQCDEVYLCKPCYETGYQMNPDYLLKSGVYNYSGVLATDWFDTEWVTVYEAVSQFS